MSFPKNLLKALSVVGVLSSLYIFIFSKFYATHREGQNLDFQLASLSQEVLTTQNLLVHQEELKRKISAARALGFLKTSNKEKLIHALKIICSESPLEKVVWKAGLGEKKILWGLLCQWIPITLTFRHAQDVDIFLFLQTLPQKIPGVVLPEQLSLSRSPEGGISGTYSLYVVTFQALAS